MGGSRSYAPALGPLLRGFDAPPVQPVITSALYHQEASDVGSRTALMAIVLIEDASLVNIDLRS